MSTFIKKNVEVPKRGKYGNEFSDILTGEIMSTLYESKFFRTGFDLTSGDFKIYIDDNTTYGTDNFRCGDWRNCVRIPIWKQSNEKYFDIYMYDSSGNDIYYRSYDGVMGSSSYIDRPSFFLKYIETDEGAILGISFDCPYGEDTGYYTSFPFSSSNIQRSENPRAFYIFAGNIKYFGANKEAYDALVQQYNTPLKALGMYVEYRDDVSYDYELLLPFGEKEVDSPVTITTADKAYYRYGMFHYQCRDKRRPFRNSKMTVKQPIVNTKTGFVFTGIEFLDSTNINAIECDDLACGKNHYYVIDCLMLKR